VTRSGRVPELDVLRFSAAASVLLFHYYELLPGDSGYQRGIATVSQFGFMGVPLFFMISGFVILWTAFNKGPRDFVLARLCRLYPSYWICVLITSAVTALAGEAVPRTKIAANLTMFQHLMGFGSIDQVYWTLFIELKFYGLVVVLLMCRQLQRIERWLAVWLALSAASLVAAVWHNEAIRGLDTVVFEGGAAYFASGCYAYLIRTQGSSRGRWIGFSVSALVSVFAALRFQYHYTHASDWKTLAATAGIIVMAHAAFAGIALRLWRLPVAPIWYWLGSLTYPLYLLHAMAGKELYGMLPPTWGVWPRIVVVLAAVFAVTILLAVTIEQRGCNALYRLLSGRWHRTPSATLATRSAVPPPAPTAAP
jgi:peptidoglycan/LPS O-acetylase OafA/YrhL